MSEQLYQLITDITPCASKNSTVLVISSFAINLKNLRFLALLEMTKFFGFQETEYVI